ncbi:MAG: TetR family transcriptional regulator [Phenylobacterium sp.]|nr:TetR family transcriptional regulator [Phenylobacterium sp.]
MSSMSFTRRLVLTNVARKRASYSSPTILARRARILELTRELIAEQGLSGFSISELGQRANVAKQTIYNIFQTKERMIATAINEYFEQREDEIHYHSPQGTMERMIERTIVAGRRGASLPHYMAALMMIYFSPDPDADIWAAIQRSTAHAHKSWIDNLAANGLLQSWIRPDVLTADMALLRNGITLEWCRGRIDIDEALRRKVAALLTTMVGATRQPVRGEIEARLAETLIHGLPDYRPPPDPPAPRTRARPKSA